VYQKQKGKSFETKIAEYLHNTFLEQCKKYADLFEIVGMNEQVKPKRDYSSGNFNDSSGDIQLNILKDFFPFHIECKFHKDFKDITLNTILNNKIKKLYNIWNNQILKSDLKRLIPILIFKGNRTDEFVFWDTSYYDNNFENFVLLDKFKIVKFEDFVIKYIELIKEKGVC
jgi:hypothetical protein